MGEQGHEHMKIPMSVKKCGICDQHHKEGLFLLSMFICKTCERKIVELDVQDPQYQWYIEQLRAAKMNTLLSH